jgi:hypothetical protein
MLPRKEFMKVMTIYGDALLDAEGRQAFVEYSLPLSLQP